MKLTDLQIGVLVLIAFITLNGVILAEQSDDNFKELKSVCSINKQ